MTNDQLLTHLKSALIIQRDIEHLTSPDRVMSMGDLQALHGARAIQMNILNSIPLDKLVDLVETALKGDRYNEKQSA